MVVWFVLRSVSTLRFVEPVIERLKDGGHQVALSFDHAPGEDSSFADVAGRLGVPVTPLALGRRDSAAGRLLSTIRTLASYANLRSRWPPLVRERWLDYFPSSLRGFIRLLDRVGLGPVLEGRPVARALAVIGRSWPLPEALHHQLSSIAPDVVVVTPAVFPDSREIDALRAARKRGVRAVAFALSWDNLTSKGMFHATPDRLFVWNDDQAREAVEWHDLDASTIDVVGAPGFDYLFDRGRRRPRDEFLERVGLPPGSSFVLYGVSSRFGLGPGGEVGIVERLAAAVAEADFRDGDRPVILVRPHPGNAVGWERLDVPGVVVWEHQGFPASEQGRTDLYNGLYHATAVVGLNTSLLVDAAIMDKPVVTMLLRNDPLADHMPWRVVHFERLTAAGFLELVDDPREASAVLARVAAGGDDRQAARRAFVERFIRPGGLERPAADVVADRLASLR